MVFRHFAAALLLCAPLPASAQDAFPAAAIDLLTRLNVPRLSVAVPKVSKPAHVETILDAIFLEAVEIPTADREQIEALIAKLGDERYRNREAASAALAAFGSRALPILDGVRRHEDPEIRFRAREARNAAQAEVNAYTNLDGNQVSTHLDSILGTISQEQLLIQLAAGLRNRMEQSSSHELHDFLAIPVIDRILLTRDDSIINLMRPILDGPNRDLARSLAMRLRSNNGERLLHLPDLLFQALRDDDAELVQVVLTNPIYPPQHDTRRKELGTVLVQILDRPLEDVARLNAAQTLFTEFRDPMGPRFLADHAEGEHAAVVAAALSSPGFIGLPLEEEVVAPLLPLRHAKNRAVRLAAVGMLLTRPESSFRKLGIEVIPELHRDDLPPLATAIGYLVSTEELRRELLAAHPGNENAQALLDEIPVGKDLGAPDLQDFPDPRFKFR